MCITGDEFGPDTLADELDADLRRRADITAKENNPPGHPVHYWNGSELVQAAPGSPEAGHKRLPGGCSLQKL